MISELNTDNKVVGAKQVKRAVQNDEVQKVFVAQDADRKVVGDILNMCEQSSIPVTKVDNMKELGKACGIDVSAAIAALLK